MTVSNLALLLFLFLPGAQPPLEMARRAIQQGDWTAAERFYREVLAGGRDLGEAHYYLAQILARQGNGTETEKEIILHFQEALDALPGQEVIWREYGSWLLSNAYFEAAGAVFDRLLQLRPGDPDYRLQLGLCHYNNRDPEAALSIFLEVLESHPERFEAPLYAGMAQRALNHLPESEQLLRKARTLAPGNREANLQLGLLLLETGRTEESLAHFRLGDSVEALYGEGTALFRLGRFDEALPVLLRLLERAPEHTKGHYQLGRLYTRMGDQLRASQHFDRFRELEARDRETRRVRETKSIVRTP